MKIIFSYSPVKVKWSQVRLFALQLQVSVYFLVSWVLYKYPETGRMLMRLCCQNICASTVITYCPWFTRGLGMKIGKNNGARTHVQLGGRRSVFCNL